MSRSSSREYLLEGETRPARSTSAHSENSSYYERHLLAPADLTVPQQPSRPNSNTSQPDYTQVSPAKIALRRHLSQEKLNQLQQAHTPTPTTVVTPLSTKTIGDLVNGEIERTLEISHQSIINAVVNKCTVGSSNGSGFTSIYNTERERLPLHERLLINPNAQRPERVNVRVVEEHLAPQAHHSLMRKSPPPATHHGNLVTLAHAAYNHKIMQANSNAYQQQSQQPQQQQQQQQHGSAQQTTTANNARVRQYQSVTLPRAEIKGCIEAYFNEDQHLQQDQSHTIHGQQTHPNTQPLAIKDHKALKEQRSSTVGRNNRISSGNNPPLEG